MLKLLTLSFAALCLTVGPPAPGTAAAPTPPKAPALAQDGDAPADAHAWAWIQVTPDGKGWTTRGGTADVTLDGERFEATLHDAEGEPLHILRGNADGDHITRVEFLAPETGRSQRGLAPLHEGRRREAFPQTIADAPEPPQRLWESITLTSLDSFVGLTRK